MANRMTKAQVIEEAGKLGIDVSGMTWPQMQKALADFKKERPVTYPVTDVPVSDAASDAGDEMTDGQKKLAEFAKNLVGKRMLISPEINGGTIQLIKYDEDLGVGYEVEEKSYLEDGIPAELNRDYVTGTYRIKGEAKKHTIAQSTIPKVNAEITMTFGVDLVPVCTFQGRSGYLWAHETLDNIKGLLIQSGYYHEYADVFSEKNDNIWYAAGKQLCVSIPLVHSIFAEIERKEALRRKNGR